MKSYVFSFFMLTILWLVCCSCDSGDNIIENQNTTEDITSVKTNAQVTKVSVSGSENNYTFSVTIKSPDTGCKQYADWWEVIDLDGNLIYRRILAHSHVNEQPFTRSGGNIDITENQEVYIRCHMNTTGYSSKIIKGSIKKGFSRSELDTSFASNIENTAPLPNGCAF